MGEPQVSVREIPRIGCPWECPNFTVILRGTLQGEGNCIYSWQLGGTAWLSRLVLRLVGNCPDLLLVKWYKVVALK